MIHVIINVFNGFILYKLALINMDSDAILQPEKIPHLSRIGRLGDWDLSHAEGQRAQRIFRSCDFARRIAEGVGIGGLRDWRIGTDFQT